LADKFNFCSTSEGSNAGAYYVAEHSDDDGSQSTFATASDVVNVDYYIDYSDTTNSHITYDDGVPTGYQIKLYASNLDWTARIDSDFSIGTTSAEDNRTGLTTKYESTETSTNIYTANTHAKRSDRTLNATSDVTNWILYKTKDDCADFRSRFTKTGSLVGFPTLDNGFGGNGTWNGTVTFTGKDTLKKNTDTSSAENYANYILEFGNYSAVRNLFTNDDYIYGNETYHYYNIGVATCDKGAVREFVQTFCNSTMNITYDDNGRVVGMEAGDSIDSGLYTVASYNDYLDAIEKAYWFVENPANTYYYTDSDGNVIDDDDLGNYNLDDLTQHDYTTSYGTVDGESHAFIYTDEEGKDIFGDDGAYTDPVQAKLIEDIIDAYNNLFTMDDYVQAENAYNEATEYVDTLDTTNYTSTSIDAYKDILSAVSDCFNYYTVNSSEVDDTDEYHEANANGEQYWRYVDLTGAEYNELKEAITALRNSSLMPVVDTGTLPTDVADKTQDLATGICDNSGSQVYTYSSWSALANEISTANSYLNSASQTDDDGFLPGKYLVTGVEEYSYGGKTYSYQTYDSDTYSDIQSTINDYNDSGTLVNTNLVSVDDDDAYESFDDAMNILNSLDTNKYNDSAVEQIEALKSSLVGSSGIVYKELTDSEREAYAKLTGEELTADVVKNTTLEKTDPQTAEILNKITYLNDTGNRFVKEFTAELTVQNEDREILATDVDNAYYGDKFEFDVSDYVDDDSSITWSISQYDNVTERNDDNTVKSLNDYANVTSSSKWIYKGTSVSRIANTNVAITAMITDAKDKSDDAVKVEIYNIYNRLIGVVYTNDTVSAGTGDDKNVLYNGSTQILTADDVPFYKFVSWNIPAKANSDGVLKVTAKYAPVGTYTITVNGGTLNSSGDTSLSYNYDSSVTITADDSIDNFYAWAVKKDGKYQIASYSSSYKFFACADEEFVPVIADTVDDNVVYTAEDNVLSANNVDSSFTLDTTTDIVQEKLAKKYPFVSLEDVRFSDDNTRVTAYVRITESSAEEPTSYGVLYRQGTSDDAVVINGTNVRKIPVNNKLSSGQFVVSLTSKSAITNNITFRAYANYDYDYSFDGTNTDNNSTSTKANALDYSNSINATPQS
jgi:hypothetical protein